MTKPANIHDNRAEGGRRKAAVNPSAVVLSREFIPNGDPGRPMSVEEMQRRAEGLGFVDATSPAATFILGRISYQHLSEYFPLFDRGPSPLRKSFKTLVAMISFDRKFQAILSEYIGTLELQLRSRYSYEMSRRYGAFAHRNPALFKNQEFFDAFLKEYAIIRRQCEKRKGSRCRRDIEKYGEMPIWEAVEEMPIGMLSRIYRNTKSPKVRESVAASFGEDAATLESWLGTITFVRNRCAHHGKLLGSKLPVMPRKMSFVDADNSNPFYVALMLMRLLRTNSFYNALLLLPSAMLAVELDRLVGSFGNTASLMGVPSNWKELVSDPNVSGIHINIRHGAYDDVNDDEEVIKTDLDLKST